MYPAHRHPRHLYGSALLLFDLLEKENGIVVSLSTTFETIIYCQKRFIT